MGKHLNNVSETITKELSLSVRNKCIVFVGAGISYNSGVPTVDILVDELLKLLSLSKRDKQFFLNKKYPFEGIMEIIKSVVSIDRFLEIFNVTEISTNHQLIAKIVKAGYIKIICTTNFDTLIEQALKNENVLFKKVSTLNQLRSIKLSSHKGVILFKLHGCIENKRELSITIKNVANRYNIFGIQNILRQLFFIKSHKNILFLGYSFSDYFDINPEIQRFYASDKKIVIVNHSKNINVGKTAPISSMSLFKNYKNGIIANQNTDLFLKFIEEKMLYEKPLLTANNKYKWIQCLNIWAKQDLCKSQLNCKILCGKLMSKIGHYDYSLKYYKAAQKMNILKNEKYNSAIINADLGRIYLVKGDYNKSRYYLNLARNYFLRVNNLSNYGKSLGDIGSAYRNQGKYNIALKFQKQALDIAEKIKDKIEIQNCLISMGNIYLSLNEYSTVKYYYKKAINLVKKTGDKTNEIILLNSLASVYIKTRKFSLAKSYLKQALNLVKKINNSRIHSGIMGSYGALYKSMGKFSHSLKSCNKALALCTDPNIKAKILKNMGETYFEIGEHENAEKYLLEAKMLFKQIDLRDKYILKDLNTILKNNKKAYYSLHLSTLNVPLDKSLRK